MHKGVHTITFRTGLASLLLATALPLFAGCPLNSSALTTAQAAPPPSSASPNMRSILPIPKVNIKKAVKRLPKLVKTVMATTGIPGMAVAIVHNGQTIYAQGFGVRGAGDSAPVTANTVFQLASLSKSIASTVIAEAIHKCAQKNSNCNLNWNTSVHEYLPNFALSDPYVTQHVTIGDVYAHRSGLPAAAGIELWELGFDQQQIFPRLAQLPLGPFRNQFAYSNTGIDAGGLAAANAMGMPWADLAEQLVFAPLGMNSTSYRFRDFLSRSNRVKGHWKQNGHWEVSPYLNFNSNMPAGGVSSTVNDMAKWMNFVLANENCSPADPSSLACTLLPALSPQNVFAPPDKPATRATLYGFGFVIRTGMSGRVDLSHFGTIPNIATNYELIPSADFGVVALTNAVNVGAGEAIVRQVSGIVQYGRVLTTWPLDTDESIPGPVGDLVGKSRPPNPVPPKPASAYVGNYTSPYFGNAKVEVKNGKLMLVLGPAPLEYELKPWNGDEFAIDLPKGNNTVNAIFPPGSVSSVWFKMGAGGIASRLTVAAFDNGLSFSTSQNPADAFSPYLRTSGP